MLLRSEKERSRCLFSVECNALTHLNIRFSERCGDFVSFRDGKTLLRSFLVYHECMWLPMNEWGINQLVDSLDSIGELQEERSVSLDRSLFFVKLGFPLWRYSDR